MDGSISDKLYKQALPKSAKPQTKQSYTVQKQNEGSS